MIGVSPKMKKNYARNSSRGSKKEETEASASLVSPKINQCRWTRNSSWFSANTDSPADSTSRLDQVRSEEI